VVLKAIFTNQGTQRLRGESELAGPERVFLESESEREGRGLSFGKVLALFLLGTLVSVSSDSHANRFQLVQDLTQLLTSERRLAADFVTAPAVRNFMFTQGAMVDVGGVRPEHVGQLAEMVADLSPRQRLAAEITSARMLRKLRAYEESAFGETLTRGQPELAFQQAGLDSFLQHLSDLEFESLMRFLRVERRYPDEGISHPGGILHFDPLGAVSEVAHQQYQDRYVELAHRFMAAPESNRHLEYASEFVNQHLITYFPSFSFGDTPELALSVEASMALEHVSHIWPALGRDPILYWEMAQVFTRLDEIDSVRAANETVLYIAGRTRLGRTELRFNRRGDGLTLVVSGTTEPESWQEILGLAISETLASGRRRHIPVDRRGRLVFEESRGILTLGPMRYNESSLRLINLITDYERLFI
jgi:hypothetical protein